MHSLKSIPTFANCVRLAVTLTFAATAVHAADNITWTGVSGDWTNAINWNPPQVPTATDHVVVSSGSVTIPANASFGIMVWTQYSVFAFVVNAGTLLKSAQADITYVYMVCTPRFSACLRAVIAPKKSRISWARHRHGEHARASCLRKAARSLACGGGSAVHPPIGLG